MVVRARLVISGNVQDVGYRTLIRKVANKLKVTGVARNMEDGNVEVYCECANKETLTKFCKTIEKKSSTEDMFILNAESIKVYEAGSKEYGDPKTDFKIFKIDYGMELDPFQNATLTRSEVGVLLLGGTRSDIKAMHTDLKDGFKETKEGLGRVEGAVNSMHKDMNQRFDSLDEKYGAIGQRMEKIEDKTTALLTEIQKSTAALVEMTQKVGALIDRKLAE